MQIAEECGQFDFRRVLRELSDEDMRLWAARFRLQRKEMDKQSEGNEAVNARMSAEGKLFNRARPE